MEDKERFTVLKGGRGKELTVNCVSLKVLSDSLTPLPVDVRIFEEDTYLVLTVDPVMRYTEEHPIRLMTKVMDTKPNKPGSIVTNNSSWYAVVHDLNSEPTCRKEWVSLAYKEALLMAEKKRIKRLGTPLLGSVHGRITIAESFAILLNTVKSLEFRHLKTIILLVNEKKIAEATRSLQNVSAEDT